MTYVCEDEKICGNAVAVTFPESSEPTPAPSETPVFTGSVGGSVEEDSVKITWTPLPSESVVYNGETYEDFQCYKLVASISDQSPQYPENGYVYAISGIEAGSEHVRAGTDYNDSDEFESFQSGVSYYFSVTYVFGSGKFTLNSVQLTMPQKQ